PAPPSIHTLSLHDALPISGHHGGVAAALPLDPDVEDLEGIELPRGPHRRVEVELEVVRRDHPRVGHVKLVEVAVDRIGQGRDVRDRKSTRLNSSHVAISYA